MKLRTAAFVLVSSALFAGTAFGQQDNRRNQDRHASSQSGQSSRSAPSNGRSNLGSRSAGNGWSRPPTSAGNQFTGNGWSQSRGNGWSRPPSNSGNQSRSHGSSQSQGNSWSRPPANTGGQSRNNDWSQSQGNSWSRPPVNTGGKSSANRYHSDPWQNGGQNRLPDSRPTHTSQGFNGSRPPTGNLDHQQGSHVQSSPAFGNNWNFGRNRDLIDRNYRHDAGIYSLQISNRDHVYQRPEWGGHWREGYSGWGGIGFRSGNFSFGLYLFTPFSEPCYVSPWYYYTSLPPYIPAERCHVVSSYYCPWNDGVVYAYGQNRGYRDSYVDQNLDNAIGEIRDGFTRQDIGAIDGLISDSGEIAVFTDGHYDYSLNAGDFHSMMADNIQNTETVRFEILSVRRSGRSATVSARHVVSNPDGTEEVVNQQYRLRDEGGRFVITDFMTSH